MDLLERIGKSNLAFRYVNYRKKDRVEYQLELNNLRYESNIRGDFRQPKVSEYTWDKIETVRLA